MILIKENIQSLWQMYRSGHGDIQLQQYKMLHCPLLSPTDPLKSVGRDIQYRVSEGNSLRQYEFPPPKVVRFASEFKFY